MSVVSIVNHALSLLAVTPIVSLQEDTKPANTANRLYIPLRDALLEERAWTFATGRAKLIPDPTPPEWGYTRKFLIPGTVIRILNVWERPPLPGQEDVTPPVEWNREGKHILATVDVIYVKMINVIEDPSQFSPAFRDLFAYRLAADMCIALTENRSLMVDLHTLYNDKLIKASSTDAAQGRRQNKYQGRLVLDR